MARYFVTVTVDEGDLVLVIRAMRRFDAEIKLRPADKLPETIGEIAERLPARTPASRARRAVGSEWPAPDSIYAVVMKALESGPKTPGELREALKADDFSSGSLNSALDRLEKAGKAQKAGDGAWAAA